MSILKPLRVEVRANPNPIPSLLVPPEIVFEVDSGCPYWRAETCFLVRHGTYERTQGSAQRYRCLHCGKTFNAAKIPAIQQLMHQVAWRLAEIVVRDGYPVNTLAKTLNVPETTLRRVITDMRAILAVNLEVIQNMRLTRIQHLEPGKSPFRVVFTDEGFIKIAGVTWYLIFGVNSEGVLLFADLISSRNVFAMKACLEECEKVVGKLEIVISDGHVPTHAALRRWNYPLIHVQHIHSGSRKRVHIHEIEPMPGQKQAKVTTIKLHNESLKPAKESVLKVTQRIVRLNSLNTSSKTKRRKSQTKKKEDKPTIHINQILTFPPSPVPKKPKIPPSPSERGWSFHLRTGPSEKSWELTELGLKPTSPSAPPGLMEHVLKLLTLTQQVFGEQTITSNQAETFNSIHDRRLTYQGCLTDEQAQRNLHAWQTVYFYPTGAQAILRSQNLPFPLSLVRKLLPWAIESVKIC